MRRFRTPLFLAFLGFTFLTVASHAFAQSASELQEQINEHNKQIAALQADIAQTQTKLNAVSQQKNTLQSAIDTLTLSQKKLNAQLQVTQNKIGSANLQIKQLSLQIGDKEETIAAHKAAIGNALRSVAEDEQPSLIAKVMDAQTLADAWTAAESLVQFNRALGDDVRTLQNTKVELSNNRDQVSAKKKELVALQNDLASQKKSVDLNKVAQQKLLADTKNQESTYQAILASKRAEEAKFEASLFDLQSKLKYVLNPKTIPPAGKGVLHWPLDDIFVTQQFGKTSSSGRLYASGTHNGVDFRATLGTPVYAALSGTVVDVNFGAVPYCQYGKWVLIKHNNGLTTLYAHLSDISVKKGQAVSTGQTIGYSGNTGYAIGPHLHVSLYVSDAVSLTQYTCKSGYTVTIPIAPINAYLDPLAYF